MTRPTTIRLVPSIVMRNLECRRVRYRLIIVFPLNIGGTFPVAIPERIGFTIDDLSEPRAPESAEGVEFFVDAEWARCWPSELVLKVRRTSRIVVVGGARVRSLSLRAGWSISHAQAPRPKFGPPQASLC